MKYSLLLGVACLDLAGCSRQNPASSVSGTWFNCEGGLAFTAERSGSHMVITVTDGRRFEFTAAPTSFGELFQSPDATLRIDDDFAVLAGGPTQNYTRCRQRDNSPEA